MTSNPDMSIVMSFLPYMKLLNDEQKLEFHLNSLQYLKNIIKYQRPPNDQQRVPQPQYPNPTAPLHFNNYSMNHSPSNLQYNSSSYSNDQSYIYPYSTYTQSNYPYNSASSYSDQTIRTTLTPTSQPSPPNQSHK